MRSARIWRAWKRPERLALRIFDTAGVELTGRVVAEDRENIVLEWPAVLHIRVVAVDDRWLELRARFLPIAFVGERYKLWKRAIRGERSRKEPELIGAYAAFTDKAKGGRCPASAESEVVLQKWSQRLGETRTSPREAARVPRILLEQLQKARGKSVKAYLTNGTCLSGELAIFDEEVLVLKRPSEPGGTTVRLAVVSAFHEAEAKAT